MRAGFVLYAFNWISATAEPTVSEEESSADNLARASDPSSTEKEQFVL